MRFVAENPTLVLNEDIQWRHFRYYTFNPDDDSYALFRAGSEISKMAENIGLTEYNIRIGALAQICPR